MVAAELDRLRDEDARWQVVHSIPIGDNDADIDHLVVGPGGVFTLNSKNHARMNVCVGGNTYMVNGTRQPYIRNTRHEVKRAS